MTETAPELYFLTDLGTVKFGLSAPKVKVISGGINHFLAISADGKELLGWGSNYRCKVSRGKPAQPPPSSFDEPTPVTLSSDLPEDIRWKDVAAGGYHSVALAENGTMYSWGEDLQGCVLGHAKPLESPRLPAPSLPPPSTPPPPVPETPTKQPKSAIPPLALPKISITDASSPVGIAALVSPRASARGSFTARRNNAETTEEATPSLTESQSEPWEEERWVAYPSPVITPVLHSGEPIKIKAVAAGYLHTLALAENGRVYSWGIGSYGRLGHGDEQNRYAPTLITAGTFDSIVITQIAANGAHSLALDSNGHPWAFGMNYDGRLGIGIRNTAQLTPKAVRNFRTESGNLTSVRELGQFVGIAAGHSHSLFLHSDGVIYACGEADALGLESSSLRRVPTAITHVYKQDADGTWKSTSVKSANIKFAAISAGRYHSIAITSTGELFAWGHLGPNFEYNRLGISDPPYAPYSVSKSFATVGRPTMVPRNADDGKLLFSSVATTWEHTIVISGAPPSLATASSAPKLPQGVKVHLKGGQTLMVLYNPELTVRRVLEKVGAKLSDFDINKYVPQDMNGNELNMDDKLGDIKVTEINFSTPKQAAARKFVVHFTHQQKNAVFWKPNLVLHEVLSKMCRNRGINIREFVPKDMQGRTLDLNATLEELGVDEITFNTRPVSMDIRVLLAGELTHTLRFVENMLLAEALSRMAEHRSYNVAKYIVHLPAPDPPSKPLLTLPPPPKPIDVTTPLSTIEFEEGKRQLVFATEKRTKFQKHVEVGMEAMRKIGQDLKELMPRTLYTRTTPHQTRLAITAAYERAAGIITSALAGHEVITGANEMPAPDTLPMRPTWYLHLAGQQNYFCGIPACALSLFFVQESSIRVAMICDFLHNDLYWAEEGEGAYLNTTTITLVSPTHDIKDATISTEFPSNSDEYQQLNYVIKEGTQSTAMATRSLGCFELECCLVAKGVVDCLHAYHANFWSLAAASLIVAESRGRMVDVDKDYFAKLTEQQTQIIYPNSSTKSLLPHTNFSVFSSSHVLVGNFQLVNAIGRLIKNNDSVKTTSIQDESEESLEKSKSYSLLEDSDDVLSASHTSMLNSIDSPVGSL